MNSQTGPQKFATDTSSLIILQKVNLLPVAAKTCELCVSRQVWQELLFEATLIQIREFEQSVTLFNIQALTSPVSADKSCLLLYDEQQCHAVLTDDGNILKRCKSQNIAHYCCLSLLSILLKQNALSKHQANMYFDKIVQVGYYSDWVVQTAKELIH